LRAGASTDGAAGVVSAVSGCAVALGVGSVGGAEGVDFGCHFFRSGVWVIGAAVAVSVSVGTDGSTVVISGMREAADFCSEDGVADFGCHFLRSTDGVEVEVLASMG